VIGTPGTSQLQASNKATGQTDGSGGNLTVAAGRGTGTGIGGALSLQVAPQAASTGSTQNALQNVLSVNGTNGAIALGGIQYSNTAAITGATIAGTHRASGVTDGIGGDLTIRGGQSTGTAAGGSLTLQVTPAGASTGTTQNAYQTVAGFTASSLTIGAFPVSSAAAGGAIYGGVNKAAGQTDAAGGTVQIQGGRGTGTGAGGSVSILIAPAAQSTGTAQNGVQTAFAVSDRNVTVGGWNTNGAAQTSFFAAPRQNTGLTDSAGSPVNIDAGSGTGTGNGGTLALRMAPPGGTTGTAQNALQAAVFLNAASGNVNIGAVNFGGTASLGASIWQGGNAATGTTDKNGGAVNINGGQGTGTGLEGNVVIRLAPSATSTGTAQNALVDVERWDASSLADPQARTITVTANNGASWVRGSFSEVITLSTSGTTTDSTANLLPANSIIDAVATYVTVTITGGGVTQFSVGDPTTAARFSASAVGLASGSNRVGLQHQQGSVTTDAAGPVQVSAAKVRITCNGTPTAGAVRVIVFYRQFTAPTS